MSFSILKPITMAKFALRPELNYHKEGDYELLHEALKKRGFYRVIWLADTATKKQAWYDLPTGTYFHESDSTFDQVSAKVISALTEIGKANTLYKRDFEVVIFRYDDVRSNLKLNTDVSKRP